MDVKEYGQLVDDYVASGSVATTISMAKDVGILDVLYQSDIPLTSQEVADRGRLKERYVREILSGLATGQVVQVDETSSLFSIKSEFKSVLKEKSIFTRLIPLMGERYEAIRKCVDKHGPPGIRYEESPVMFPVMDELRTLIQDKIVTDALLPAVNGLETKLRSGIDVAEVGCANGTIILNLSQRFPASCFTGSDVVESVLESARGKATKRGITNCQFEIIDVCHISASPRKQFDWIYARCVIHDIPDPQGALSGICRLLKPGGIFSMLEYEVNGELADNVGNLYTAYLYSTSTFMCIPESYQGQDSMALGPCWHSDKARVLVEEAGMEVINVHKYGEDTGEVHIVCRKPE